jgi:hypothetical protein
MVGTIAAMITGAIGFMEQAHLANRLRLDAAEVAHRVIIQQIDDDKLWKQEANRVELNGTVFEFTLNLEVLTKDDSAPEGRARRNARATTEVSFNERLVSKLHLITAQVWAVDPPQLGPEPLASITRVYDILDVQGDELFGRIIRMQEEDLQRQIDAAREQRDRNREQGGNASAPAPAPRGGSSR